MGTRVTGETVRALAMSNECKGDEGIWTVTRQAQDTSDGQPVSTIQIWTSEIA